MKKLPFNIPKILLLVHEWVRLSIFPVSCFSKIILPRIHKKHIYIYIYIYIYSLFIVLPVAFRLKPARWHTQIHLETIIDLLVFTGSSDLPIMPEREILIIGSAHDRVHFGWHVLEISIRLLRPFVTFGVHGVGTSLPILILIFYTQNFNLSQ
jgi:hypothetical protein